MARRDTWESATRDAFLRGYFAGSRAPQAGILPRARASADRIIQLFEIEKAFYELQYEIDHRPDWSWIPDAAIERLTARRSP